MKRLLIGLIFFTCVIENQSHAQELWIFAGGSISAELQKEFGDLGGGTAIPFSIVYAKQVSPKFSWVIAPTFEAYKLILDFSGTDDVWKKTNIELPILAKYHLAGIKAISFGTGAYVGITIKSTLVSSAGDQKITNRNPYFGIPVWVEAALGRFGLGFRTNIQLTDVSPKEYPIGNNSLFEHYENLKTTRIGFQVVLGYRII